MGDKGKETGEKILKDLESEANEKLKAIQQQIITSNRAVDENIQILMDVSDDLDDILLYWEETYVPDMLKIADGDDLD